MSAVPSILLTVFLLKHTSENNQSGDHSLRAASGNIDISQSSGLSAKSLQSSARDWQRDASVDHCRFFSYGLMAIEGNPNRRKESRSEILDLDARLPVDVESNVVARFRGG
jgi:hypothetical protein